jgi:hypothetical protein
VQLYLHAPIHLQYAVLNKGKVQPVTGQEGPDGACSYTPSLTSELDLYLHAPIHLQYVVLNKGKVQPVTGQEGPDGECSYTPSLTSELYVGGGSTPRSSRFTLRNNPVLIV